MAVTSTRAKSLRSCVVPTIIDHCRPAQPVLGMFRMQVLTVLRTRGKGIHDFYCPSQNISACVLVAGQTIGLER